MDAQLITSCNAQQHLNSSFPAVVRPVDLQNILQKCPKKIQTLSLDCFDTLLWRAVATPRDIFYIMEQQPLARLLGVTAYQRIQAQLTAFRGQEIRHASNQISLEQIYRQFTGLSPAEQSSLIEEELRIEAEFAFAFYPFLELMEQACARGFNLIIVSDTYLTVQQLTQLLRKKCPAAMMDQVQKIFCSLEYGTSKSLRLFHHVLQVLDAAPETILHIGDNFNSDVLAAKSLGIHAVHFVQDDPSTKDFLKIQEMADASMGLRQPNDGLVRAPRYSPYRGIFSLDARGGDTPAHLIGYYSFGPILYGFARFICEDLARLAEEKKNLKVFFLLRDAHLLARACAAYAGKPLGKEIRIRKFGVVAAAFRTVEDVDHYLTSLEPQHYDYHVICDQLLLPYELAQILIQKADATANHRATFNALIHQEAILACVFEASKKYRERLKAYLVKEMAPMPGDTIVLVDTGYRGITQEFLIRGLAEELGVTVLGRYCVGSHLPNRPDSKAFLVSAACDHGIFEQASTLKEGAVVDYDGEGSPVFEALKLSEEQYAKAQNIQEECVQFIEDAVKFFKRSQCVMPLNVIQQAAIASLRRHLYFPLAQEMDYFACFQHDKDMGAAGEKTFFNCARGLTALRLGQSPKDLHPYELRFENIHWSWSTLLQRRFEVDLPLNERSLRCEMVKIAHIFQETKQEHLITAVPTYDGYFLLEVPDPVEAVLWIRLGAHYHWVQIMSILLVNPNGEYLDFSLQSLSLFEMQHQKTLFECESQSSALCFAPLLGNVNNRYRIIFRPLEKW